MFPKLLQGKPEQNLTQLLKLIKRQQIIVVTTTSRDFKPFLKHHSSNVKQVSIGYKFTFHCSFQNSIFCPTLIKIGF